MAISINIRKTIAIITRVNSDHIILFFPLSYHNNRRMNASARQLDTHRKSGFPFHVEDHTLDMAVFYSFMTTSHKDSANNLEYIYSFHYNYRMG